MIDPLSNSGYICRRTRYVDPRITSAAATTPNPGPEPDGFVPEPFAVSELTRLPLPVDSFDGVEIVDGVAAVVEIGVSVAVGVGMDVAVAVGVGISVGVGVGVTAKYDSYCRTDLIENL
jgi:hypothetical protein